MGGSLITSRGANALSTTVTVRPVVGWLLRRGTSGTFDWLIRRVRESNEGGLWVGGTLYLFSDRVQFKANLANRLVQTDAIDFDLKLTEVASVDWRPGLLTGIIELSHAGKIETVRCFGSKKLAVQIASLRAANVV